MGGLAGGNRNRWGSGMHGTFWPRALPVVLLTSLMVATAAPGPVSGSAMASSLTSASATAPATVPSGAPMAAVAAASLQRMYNPSTGLFCRKLNANCWWDSANKPTASIAYSKHTGSRRYLGDLARTYVRGQYAGPDGRSRGPFTDSWFDDDAWWALAWVDAYKWQPRE